MLTDGMIFMLFSLLNLLSSAFALDDSVCCGSKYFDLFPPAQVNFYHGHCTWNQRRMAAFLLWSSWNFGLWHRILLAPFTSITLLPLSLALLTLSRLEIVSAIYLNGTFLGNTTLSSSNYTSYTIYPNEAWVQSNFSHGEWLIPAGLHRLTIKVLESVMSATALRSGAFIRADINPAIPVESVVHFVQQVLVNVPSAWSSKPARLLPQQSAKDLPDL